MIMMKNPSLEQTGLACLAIAVALAMALPVAPSEALAAETSLEKKAEALSEGDGRSAIGRGIYWEDGIQLTAPGKKFSLHIGGKLNYDFGEISADDELQEVFPGLDGFHSGFRRLRVSLLGEWEKVFEFKVEVDVDELGDIKDNWIRFLRGPILPHFTFGHMKEPFSLDMLTGGNFTTLMEFSLPTRTFGPFRNIGTAASGTWKGERLTWAAGFFVNTGSFNEIGSATDKISEANGYNLTARLTGLPIFDEKKEKLLHLGLSYSHRFRDPDAEDPDIQLRTRPESRLTDDRLVDTGRFNGDDGDVLALEAAFRQGPFSLQGEYFHLFQDFGETLEFRGWYLLGSWVVTGERRIYKAPAGVFTGLRPKKSFNPGKGGWGALELALRYSFVDLSDGVIRGGEERNFSAGINWYLARRHRVMVNYIRAKVENRAEPPVDDGEADILMCRFQVAF